MAARQRRSEPSDREGRDAVRAGADDSAQRRRRPSTTDQGGSQERAERDSGRADEDEIFDERRGVFMISVAAELAGMHPQTLRMYEARGLIKPSRSPKRTRLYSQHDVELLRRIQDLTSKLGLNLAGVERVLEMEHAMEAMRERLERLQDEAEEMERRLIEEIEAVHRSYKRELVRWEPPGEALRMKDGDVFKIPIEKARRHADGRDSDDGSNKQGTADAA
jgi:MerR family transcriptional regulator/heat shock protein HspR